MKDMFNVGKIVNTHGIRGELKILRISDFVERFQVGNVLYVKKDQGQPEEFKIKSHRIHKGFDLITFEGVTNINQVEHLKGSMLMIDESQQTKLDSGEFYYHEIINCTVQTIDGRELGVVKEILSPGANDVWVIKQKQGKDILIPYIEQVVKEIDIQEKLITIEAMEGLLD